VLVGLAAIAFAGKDFVVAFGVAEILDFLVYCSYFVLSCKEGQYGPNRSPRLGKRL
jgi:hypothetical protein